MTGSEPAEPAAFVTRCKAMWHIAPVDAEQSTRTDLAGVLALIGIDAPAIGTSARPTDVTPTPLVPADLARIFEPTWLLVGGVDPGTGLVVAGAHGEPLLLDAVDLTLLDALNERSTVAELLSRTGIEDAIPRLDRLVAERRVVAVPTPSAPAPQPRRPRWRRPGRTAPTAGGRPSASPAPASAPRHSIVGPSGGPHPGGPPGRIPVYAIWHPHAGPLLSLGMLTAAARHHRGGALNELYEIRRPESAASFLEDLATRSGPAVLLCSDYVWSLTENLAAARAGLRLNPDLVVIHGGPSSPKYEADAERFLSDHSEVSHILTRGEGEHLVCDLLDALAPTLPGLDGTVLAGIDGLTFRMPGSGVVVRTPDRDRISDLDALPSPYLTGEFDHIASDQWNTCLAIETNRGCPYGCTFCDWGSSTMSRIRMFSLDRVIEEVRWAAARGIDALNVPDANFGIMSRDVETATRVAAVKAEFGYPRLFVFYLAKNTTKHLVRIQDILVEAGIATSSALSMQTVDEHTLAVLERSNIATDHFVALAADFRRRGHPLVGDLILGMPGQTYESFRRDLQFMIDHEITARIWLQQILPNAPMNAPDYRAEHGIESDDEDVVVSAASFSREDRARMIRLRKIDIICERLGLLRHVMRWLQWDHDIPASAFMDHLLDLTADDPHRYPHLTWVLNQFDRHPTAPFGWAPFYEEVRDLLQTDFGVTPSTALDTVLRLNQFLMPAPGRTFPATIELDHDYVAYYRAATDSLYATGHASRPPRLLSTYPAGPFVVEGDPLDLCGAGLSFASWGTGAIEGDFIIGGDSANELLSPLLRLLPHAAAAGMKAVDRGPFPEPAPTRRRLELTVTPAR